MSREYSENVLVQNSAGNLLQNVLGWEEVLLSDHAIQIPLSASNADWAAGLQRMLQQPCDRSAGAELIRQAGYDINIAAARLQQQYLQLSGEA